MTADEAKREVNKAFEPAFANYIIEALTNGATCSDKRESSTDAVSREYLLSKAYAYGNGLEPDGYCVEVEDIQNAPPVTPKAAKVIDLDGLKQDMKALNCGFPYGLDYLLECIKNRLGITIN